MNTRGKVQLISGQILEYFRQQSPLWSDLSKDFSRCGIYKLTGMEKLSEEFLRCIFKNSPEIMDKIEFFKAQHHYLVILLLKDEYSLESCLECGYLTRKNDIILEGNPSRHNSSWTIDC